MLRNWSEQGLTSNGADMTASVCGLLTTIMALGLFLGDF